MRKTLLLVALALSGGMAQADEFGRALNHVTVVVSDFESSKQFYLDTLGLKHIEAPWLPQNQMFVAVGEGLELHVGEVEGIAIAPNNFNHFAISVDKFDEYLEHLKSKGVVYTRLGGGDDYEVSLRPDDVRQTWLKDPDGYWIEINDVK